VPISQGGPHDLQDLGQKSNRSGYSREVSVCKAKWLRRNLPRLGAGNSHL
jgi:hypothetical protein